MPSVLLFGAGAVGAVYTYTFMQAGARVIAVCRGNYDAVKRDGFQIHSLRFGNVHFKPDVVRTAEEAGLAGPWDFVVICCKSLPGSSPSLSDLIRPAVSPSTAIVLIQNGIGIENEVAAAFPDNPVLSCVAYLPATQIRPGVIDNGASQKTSLNRLEIGTYPASAPQSHKHAAEQLALLVRKGGGGAEVFDDVQPKRWTKLVINASWNPSTALSLCNDVDFRRSSPGATDFIRNVMLEVVGIAKALDIEGVDESLVDQQISHYTSITVGKDPSMLADVRNNRPFEIEAIVGNTVRLAKTLRVKVPLLDALYILGKALYEAQARSRINSAAIINGA